MSIIRTVQPVYSYKVEGDKYKIYRDADPLQTPRVLPVVVPSRALAESIVMECSGQGEKLDLRNMPLTQMTLTAIDIAEQHRTDIINGIMRYTESELLCHRVDEPTDLATRQSKIWQPYLDWCRVTFHADLSIGQGITPISQDPAALAALRTQVETYDAFYLVGISEAVSIIGSLVLALALVNKYATVTAILNAAELDSIWQAQKWGEDPATQKRRETIRSELETCSTWFSLLDGRH